MQSEIDIKMPSKVVSVFTPDFKTFKEAESARVIEIEKLRKQEQDPLFIKAQIQNDLVIISDSIKEGTKADRLTKFSDGGQEMICWNIKFLQKVYRERRLNARVNRTQTPILC